MKEKNQIRELTFIALFAAMTYIAGSIVKIPSVGGFVHIGDCMVFVSAYILGSRRGAIASGIGMLLVDVLGGYMVWAPFTFVIKFLMAFIAGFIIEKAGSQTLRVVLPACISAGIFMVFAYFFAGAIIALFISGNAISIAAGLAYAAKDIPGNIVQVSTGIAIAAPVCAMLKRFKLELFT